MEGKCPPVKKVVDDMTCFNCARRDTDARDRENGPGSYASWCEYRKLITSEDGEIVNVISCKNFKSIVSEGQL